MLRMDIHYCLQCGKPFKKLTAKHRFCCKECLKNYKETQRLKKPGFICPNCSEKTELSFSPKSNKNLWLQYECPHCHYTIRDQYGDFGIIKQIRHEFKVEVWFESDGSELSVEEEKIESPSPSPEWLE